MNDFQKVVRVTEDDLTTEVQLVLPNLLILSAWDWKNLPYGDKPTAEYTTAVAPRVFKALWEQRDPDTYTSDVLDGERVELCEIKEEGFLRVVKEVAKKPY